MPAYEFDCPSCGPFTALRPMSMCTEPQACPECGSAAARVILTPPAFAATPASRRQAYATNERASHEPKLSSQHPQGCACCSSGRKTNAVLSLTGEKSFPTQRPWMISH